jgi:hypothetical protein
MYQLTDRFSRELTDAEVNQIHLETSRYFIENRIRLPCRGC